MKKVKYENLRCTEKEKMDLKLFCKKFSINKSEFIRNSISKNMKNYK